MEPYLSIVVASRNDNHGEDMLKRMTIFVNGLLHQTRKHKLRAELIFVEWNPPKGKPLLNEVLPKPSEDDVLTIRYIIVPEEIHLQYKTSIHIPLFQMIAKNVGIRRAKGKFILCTNVDLLFSDELCEILSREDLSAEYFYRANRCDIPASIDYSLTFDRQLDFAQKNILRRLGISNNHSNLFDAKPWIFKNNKFASIVNTMVGIKRGVFDKKNKLENIIRRLDTEACGDFALMSKETWLDIQGYLELDMYSIHVDTLAVYVCCALGYDQFVFPADACIYHIDHKDGWS